MGIAPFDSEPDEMQDTGELMAIVKDHKIKAAMQFLRQELANGPRWAAEVEAKAKAAGHAHATLVLARKNLYINSHRVNGRWQWTTAKQRQALGIKSKRQSKSQASLSQGLSLTNGRSHNGAVTVS